MVSTEIRIPEDCHIIIGGIDYAGKLIIDSVTHLDGTGEFKFMVVAPGELYIQSVKVLDKSQAKQLCLAFAKERVKYLESELGKVRSKVDLIESGTWPIPVKWRKINDS